MSVMCSNRPVTARNYPLVHGAGWLIFFSHGYPHTRVANGLPWLTRAWRFCLIHAVPSEPYLEYRVLYKSIKSQEYIKIHGLNPDLCSQYRQLYVNFECCRHTDVISAICWWFSILQKRVPWYGFTFSYVGHLSNLFLVQRSSALQNNYLLSKQHETCSVLSTSRTSFWPRSSRIFTRHF